MTPVLESFEIHAFRGLSSITLGPLGRLNLLVGGDNSGKTSVLEALAVYAAPQDIIKWASIARQRELPAPMVFREGLSPIEAIRWLFPHQKKQDKESDELLPLSLVGHGSWEVVAVEATCTPFRGIPPRRPVSSTTARAQAEDSTADDSAIEEDGWLIRTT